MSANAQKVVLAICFGVAATGISYLAALYVDAAGGKTAARMLLWPAELAGWGAGHLVVVDGDYDHTGQLARGIAGFLFGFPLGAIVYGALGYLALNKWRKT